MNVFDAIEQRRSIKHFDPGHRMSDDEVRRLLESALLSPTAFNIQNWRFVVVEDPDIRGRIRAAAWDQPQVTEASLLVVLCLDLKSWDREPERYWRNAPAEVAEQLVPDIRGFYRDAPQLQRDEGMRSCGIAAQTLMLAAKAMGYDSCAMDGFDFARVGELINLPADHEIAMMIAVGKAVKGPHARAGQLSLDEVCFRDRFPDRSREND